MPRQRPYPSNECTVDRIRRDRSVNELSEIALQLNFKLTNCAVQLYLRPPHSCRSLKVSLQKAREIASLPASPSHYRIMTGMVYVTGFFESLYDPTSQKLWK